jgi:hypothetical protein
MTFRVDYQPNSGITAKDEFGDEAVYDFIEGGILKIVSPDTGGKVSYTPPTVWMGVSTDKEHKPGKTNGGGGGGATLIR